MKLNDFNSIETVHIRMINLADVTPLHDHWKCIEREKAFDE